MNHASLFSGIGGFDMAAEWMGWTNVLNCEIDPFCQKVLKYHFPNAVQLSDIKQAKFKRDERGDVYIRRTIADTDRDGCERINRKDEVNTIKGRFNALNDIKPDDNNESQTEEWQNIGPVDILTGGFPCQPFSMAGKRRGTEDDRHLWPEMLRTIREIKPRWVVGENVFGFTNWNGGLVFREVLSDLGNEGYEVQPYIIPACAVNAPHRRDRVWIVAYRKGERLPVWDAEQIRDGSHSTTERHNSISYWHDFPTQPPLRSRDDGFPGQLDGITVSKLRNESIKAYGNAIVPQVALQIFQAIEQYERRQS